MNKLPQYPTSIEGFSRTGSATVQNMVQTPHLVLAKEAIVVVAWLGVLQGCLSAAFLHSWQTGRIEFLARQLDSGTELFWLAPLAAVLAVPAFFCGRFMRSQRSKSLLVNGVTFAIGSASGSVFIAFPLIFR